MIEEMKVVHVVATAAKKDALLGGLRELGVIHFAEGAKADQSLLERFSSLSSMASVLRAYITNETEQVSLSDEAFNKVYADVSACVKREKTLKIAKASATVDAEKIREWGNFEPAEVTELRERGLDFHFYSLGKKTLAALSTDKDIRFVRLSSVGKLETIAVLDTLPTDYMANEFQLPQKSLKLLEKEVTDCERGLQECDDFLRSAARYLSDFYHQLLKTQNNIAYSSVSNSTESSDDLVWISGYIPASESDRFRCAAAKNDWAWVIDDPADDDEKIPTKVKYNKVTRLMIPIFDILGTVPGYHECDISFWFLGFFTLFFAMIIGDAGYGCLFMLVAAAMTIKTKKPSNTSMLLWVLSAATIVWGAITGTWFGFEEAMHIPLLKALVIPSFANYPEYFNVTTTQQQNTVMKFCFILGTIQLSLACIINIRRKLGQKDLSWLADVGWLSSICALYFVVLYLVIGAQVDLIPSAIVILIGFLQVVLFGGMSSDKTFGQGLKAGLADTFTVFLNTISAFGNIMSYIRLFAVGLASLAIAQSFNNMASGFNGALIIVGILIMIVGQTMNIVMGLLSVVVHGVRLNLLEFSGQLGMEWAGIAYRPFKKLDKLKNN